MPHLGENGKNLNDDIGSFVKKGLDPDVQRALDALRVIGNNAVHPLELDLRDDVDTVSGLFNLLNYIVEDRIARPNKLATLYAGLPEGALAAIEKRDQDPASAGDHSPTATATAAPAPAPTVLKRVRLVRNGAL
jgi:hypothetical protein